MPGAGWRTEQGRVLAERYSTKQLVLQEERQGRIDFRAEDSVEGNVRSRAGQRTQQHRAE